MYLIQRTDTFDKWLKKLKDTRAKAKILTKLKSVELGNLGDYKSIHSRIFEFRIHYGPGYRIYFTIKKQRIILLLVGGVKESQKSDIEKAKRVLEGVEKNNE